MMTDKERTEVIQWIRDNFDNTTTYVNRCLAFDALLAIDSDTPDYEKCKKRLMQLFPIGSGNYSLIDPPDWAVKGETK